MEALLTHGEGLVVPERMIVAPSVGVFRPVDDVDAGALVVEGQPVGVLDGPGTSVPVCSPFCGKLVGMLVHPGERLREGQPVAWMRVVSPEATDDTVRPGSTRASVSEPGIPARSERAIVQAAESGREASGREPGIPASSEPFAQGGVVRPGSTRASVSEPGIPARSERAIVQAAESGREASGREPGIPASSEPWPERPGSEAAESGR